MTEKDLIKKIQKLKQIKPREEWVFLCKNQILGTEQRTGLPVFNSQVKLIFRTLFQRQMVWQRVLVLFLITIIFALGIIYFRAERDPNEIALFDTLIEIEKLTPVLEQTRLSISQTAIDLQEITEIEQALITERIVVSTIESGRIVVEEAKEIEQKIIEQEINKDKGQILAAMTNEIIGLENALSEMENSFNDVYASIAEREIRNLEKILRQDQQALQELLKQAKQHFERAEYMQSLMLINKISQIVYSQ